MFCSFLFLVWVIFGVPLAQSESNGPVVKLPQGLVQGTYQLSYKNRTFSAFEGIPYGKPPVGNLRFEEPEPAEGWKDVLIADKHYECLHLMPFPVLFGPRGTEDCLFIYVYVPREKIDVNELLDVVVHIHGGAFMLGAPKYMAGPQFLMDREVVFVSFNYRLGILGFLSTENEIVPGNNGLKDQSLALTWIHDNIKYFGGNPASVTITGLSAGGASVHFHYLSTWSRGLFHRGFSQSGNALNPWALTEKSLSYTQAVAKNLSCPAHSIRNMIDCLKELDGITLMRGVRSVFVYMNAIPFVPFGPVVEKNSKNPFLSENPYKILSNKNVYDVPWINSNVKDEGLLPVGFFLFLKKLHELDNNFDKIMLYALDLHNTVDNTLHKEVMDKIKQLYFHGEPVSDENIFSLSRLFSDRLFLVDSEKAVRLHSEAVKSEVYYYLYSYILQMPSFPPGMPKGASHGDDGRLLFKMFFTPTKLTESDEQMMELFTNFIATFAKKGFPSFGNSNWRCIQPGSSDIEYLHIDGTNSTSMKSVKNLAPSDFWQSLPIVELEKAAAWSSAISLSKNMFIIIIVATITSLL